MRAETPSRRAGTVPALLATGLALLCIAARVRSAPRAAAGESPWKQAPERFVLATGEVCLFQRDAVSPTTVVHLFVPGGKAAVPAGLDGLAYLATRLTLEIPDYAVAQDMMAQATCLRLAVLEDCSFVTLECLSENLEAGLRVAAAIIQNPLITGPRIEDAKQTMSIYAKAEGDDAAEAGHAAALGAFFGGRGYGGSTFGTEASLKAIGKKDIVSFYGLHFTRHAVVFAVSSDLGRDRVQPLLEKYFAKFAARAVGPAAAVEPALPEVREVRLEKETKQAFVGRAFLLPPPTKSGFAKGYLLHVLLGVGPGSRLWDLRAGQKLAYNVGARLTWMRGCGLIEAYLETGTEKREAAVVALDAALAELRRTGLAPDEMSMTKSLARTHLLRSLERKGARAQMMGHWEILGPGLEAFEGAFDGLDAVGLEEMNAFLRDVLDPAKSLLVVVGGGKGRP
ncbi:MAG TPA: insulinase family protein [Terriglobales bacterium]|nr:insulinase family protein [Terriglobales bacterium]